MSTRMATLGVLLIAGVFSGCDEQEPSDPTGEGASEAQGGETGVGASASTSGHPEEGGAGGEAVTTTGGGGQPVNACGNAGPQGDLEVIVTSDGEERRALVHVPEGVQEGEPPGLVIALHGFTASPEDMRDITHLDEIADQRGFLVAYPEGMNGSWNGGVCCGQSEWNGVDDVGFIAALIDELSQSHCIDPARIHVTGFSNGGFLTHSVACELADRVASVGVVAGQQGTPTCEPSRPIAVLQIHGSADPVVPFGGNTFLGYPSTTSTVDGWAERDACGAEAAVTYDQDGTLCEARTTCEAGATVELCTVDGGAHDWFGGGTAWTEGSPPEGFVATLKIVDFFEAHPMP